jgi:hypothetical protein
MQPLQSQSRRRPQWSRRLESRDREGVVVEVLCPEDQTAEENAEKEINEATLNYSEDVQGRAIGLPKINPFKKP